MNTLFFASFMKVTVINIKYILFHIFGYYDFIEYLRFDSEFVPDINLSGKYFNKPSIFRGMKAIKPEICGEL